MCRKYKIYMYSTNKIYENLHLFKNILINCLKKYVKK